MTDMNNADAMREVVALARKSQEVVDLGDNMTLIRDGDGDFDIVDLGHLYNPRRLTGTTVLTDHRSLISYCNMAVELEWPHLFADVEAAHLTAVLNSGSFGDHRARLELATTQEYRDWRDISGKWHDQADLADFLDGHRHDVHDPELADLLEIVQTMQVGSTVSFNSRQRLDNGDLQFTYTNEVDGKAGRSGELTIPKQVTISVPIFEGDEATHLTGFLRYRLSNGTLKLALVFTELERQKRERVHALVREVEEAVKWTDGSNPVLFGRPRAVQQVTATVQT